MCISVKLSNIYIYMRVGHPLPYGSHEAGSIEGTIDLTGSITHARSKACSEECDLHVYD